MRSLVMLAMFFAATAAAAQPSAGGPQETAEERHDPRNTDGAPPKIGIVVAGDPDETLRTTAQLIEQESVLAGMQTPSDPALRAAMRGEPATAEDGLERLRAIRRGLGLDPRQDQASYRRIGAIAGADALVVVRREGHILIEVFDVSAAQFYEGLLDFDRSESDARIAFIESRAQEARRRWAEPAPPPPPPSTGPEINPAEGEADESRAKKRWKKAWPYVLAGVVLAGGVTYLIIDRRNAPDSGVPLLRFRPGDE